MKGRLRLAVVLNFSQEVVLLLTPSIDYVKASNGGSQQSDPIYCG